MAVKSTILASLILVLVPFSSLFLLEYSIDLDYEWVRLDRPTKSNSKLFLFISLSIFTLIPLYLLYENKALKEAFLDYFYMPKEDLEK